MRTLKMPHQDIAKFLLAAAKSGCLERTAIGKACSDASPEYSLQAAVAQGFPWVEVLPLCLADTKFVVVFFCFLFVFFFLL